jgi:tetratricopeptide (TPR) repeat protein
MILDPAVDKLVGDAMATYRQDPDRADLLFNVACTQLADPLPLYRVLYKFYNRQRRFDHAHDFAGRALAEAARQSGLPEAPRNWMPEMLAAADPLLASQCLLALKALSFISLRRGDEAGSLAHLETLLRLDPEDGSGVSVVAALAESVREAG